MRRLSHLCVCVCVCAIAVPAAANPTTPTTYAVSSLRLEAQSWTYVPLLARTQLPDGSSTTAAHSVLAIPDPATRTGDNFIALWYTPDPAQPTGWSAVAWNTRTSLEKVYAQIADQLNIPDDPALDEWPYVPELSTQEIFADDLPFPLANGVAADDPLAPVLDALPPETQGELLDTMAGYGYGADDGTGPLRAYDPCDPSTHGVTDEYVRVFGRGLTSIAQATPFDNNIETFANVFITGITNPNPCETGAGGGGAIICNYRISGVPPAWPAGIPAVIGGGFGPPTPWALTLQFNVVGGAWCDYRRTATRSRTVTLVCAGILCPTVPAFPGLETQVWEETIIAVPVTFRPCPPTPPAPFGAGPFSPTALVSSTLTSITACPLP